MNFECKEKTKVLSMLIEKTEQNINRIQNVSDSFVYPVLNEWRYATKHIANIFTTEERDCEIEIQKAVAHLNRAYIDSCEVLLTTYLHQAFLFLKRYRHIRYLTNEHQFYSEYLKQYIAGRRLLGQTAWDEAKEAYHHAQALESVIANLERCYVKSMELESDFEYLRESYYKHRSFVTLSIIVSLVSVALSIIFIFLGR